MPAPVEKVERLSVNKKLNKFCQLPSRTHWRVQESTVVATGKVMTMIRAKGLLVDTISQMAVRDVTVTKEGFLIIYCSNVEGLVVDIRKATNVLACEDYHTGRVVFKRCHLKIRLPAGNIHFYLRGSDIAKWRDAVYWARDSKTARNATPRPAPRTAPVPRARRARSMTLVDGLQTALEDVRCPARSPTMTAVPDEEVEVESNTNTLVASPSRSFVDLSISTNSGAITDDIVQDEVPSIRNGRRSVTSLRKMLEKKFKETKTAPVKVSAPPKPQPRTPSANQQMQKVEIRLNINKELEFTDDIEPMPTKENEWWNTSLRC